MNIKQAIQRIVKPMLHKQVVVGTVQSVDMNTMTCDVEVEQSYMRLGVRLKAVEDSDEKGFILVPKEGSEVSIRMVEDNRNMWELSMVSEVDQVIIGGSDFGGLIKIEELVSKINRLESKLNSLVSKYNSHVHVTTATIGASATVGALSSTVSTETAIAPETQRSDLENERIKHG